MGVPRSTALPADVPSDQHEARRRFDIAVHLLQSGEPQVFKADLEEIAETFALELGDEQAAEQLRQIAARAASA